MSWRSSLMRVLIILILLGVVSATTIIWREYKRSMRIQAEIDRLEQEADKIRRENHDLREKIMYFTSPDFHEREAKEKLGYRRLEEEVIVVQGAPAPGALYNIQEETSLAEIEKKEIDDTPRYRKWWNFFFHQ